VSTAPLRSTIKSALGALLGGCCCGNPAHADRGSIAARIHRSDGRPRVVGPPPQHPAPTDRLIRSTVRCDLAAVAYARGRCHVWCGTDRGLRAMFAVRHQDIDSILRGRLRPVTVRFHTACNHIGPYVIQISVRHSWFVNEHTPVNPGNKVIGPAIARPCTCLNPIAYRNRSNLCTAF